MDENVLLELKPKFIPDLRFICNLPIGTAYGCTITMLILCILPLLVGIFEINSFIKKSRSIKEQQTEAAETTNDEIKETEEIKFDSFLAEKVFKNEKEIESLSDK